MNQFLQNNDVINVVEQGKTAPVVHTVKILKNLNQPLMQTFTDLARPNEGFLQFIINRGIGRVIIPRESYIHNTQNNSVVLQE